MYKYIYPTTILLSAVFVTVYADPFWLSYINIINKIDNPIVRSLVFNVVVPWILSLIVYWSLGTIFLLIDKYKLPATLYNTKYQKNAETKNSVSLTDCIKQVIFNQIFALLPGLCVLNLIGNIKVTPEIPSLYVIICDLILAALFGELCYYFSHRLLHTGSLYAKIHKRHHNYKAPIAIVSLYAHPLEVLVGNTFAVIGPIYMLGVHSYTLYLGIVIGFIDSLSDHAGYDVKNRFHDLHHQLTNYNFGSIGILDRLLGTYRDTE